MRYVRQADGSIREVLDVTHCPKCGDPFAPREYTLGWIACQCAGGIGHRKVHCLREQPDGTHCNGEILDPP